MAKSPLFCYVSLYNVVAALAVYLCPLWTGSTLCLWVYSNVCWKVWPQVLTTPVSQSLNNFSFYVCQAQKRKLGLLANNDIASTNEQGFGEEKGSDEIAITGRNRGMFIASVLGWHVPGVSSSLLVTLSFISAFVFSCHLFVIQRTQNEHSTRN